MRKQEKKSEDWIEYYEHGDILDEITDENITIKIDPLQIIAIKKLATMKSIPYQTLIRHWLAQDIKKELERLPG